VAGLVLDRCEETLAQTPRVMCCWLRSWGTQFYAYPFELPQRPATQSRYRLYLHRFLCYVFRAWHLCQRQRQGVRETYGFLLSASQVQTTELIWSELTALSLAEAASATVLSPPSALRESLFQLLVMFWTDISADGVVEGKATINFSGVLASILTSWRSAPRTTAHPISQR
jgi:hypothetical protein